MICLTGDVHSSALGTPEQGYTTINEPSLAVEYLDIVSKYDLKATLFVTGRACSRHQATVQRLAEYDCVELAAHTFSALRPRWLHKGFRKAFGSAYGPKPFQRWDVNRAIEAIESISGEPVAAWRTHAYASDNRTTSILHSTDVRLISDHVAPPSERQPQSLNGLISLPINTLRDHGHIYHAERTGAAVEWDPNSGDWFERSSYSPMVWVEIVREQIESIVSADGIATIQAHPLCMKTADDFSAFESLCSWISDQNLHTMQCRDVVNGVDAGLIPLGDS